MKGKIIAVANQKGGVGKSSTLLALGAGLRAKGYSVLYVDLDPQGNASFTLEANNAGLIGNSSLDVLMRQTTVADAIQHTPNGDVIASSPALAGADIVLTAIGKEQRLREALEPLRSAYDYILLDTPPALGILTVNALTACDGVIVPAQPDMYSLQGIGQLNTTIETIRQYCNPRLRVLGILLTRYNGRASIGKEVAAILEQIAGQMKSKLYKSRIRECTALKEALAYKTDIYTYAPKSNAATDYKAFVDEIIAEEI